MSQAPLTIYDDFVNTSGGNLKGETGIVGDGTPTYAPYDTSNPTLRIKSNTYMNFFTNR